MTINLTDQILSLREREMHEQILAEVERDMNNPVIAEQLENEVAKLIAISDSRSDINGM